MATPGGGDQSPPGRGDGQDPGQGGQDSGHKWIPQNDSRDRANVTNAELRAQVSGTLPPPSVIDLDGFTLPQSPHVQDVGGRHTNEPWSTYNLMDRQPSVYQAPNPQASPRPHQQSSQVPSANVLDPRLRETSGPNNPNNIVLYTGRTYTTDGDLHWLGTRTGHPNRAFILDVADTHLTEVTEFTLRDARPEDIRAIQVTIHRNDQFITIDRVDAINLQHHAGWEYWTSVDGWSKSSAYASSSSSGKDSTMSLSDYARERRREDGWDRAQNDGTANDDWTFEDLKRRTHTQIAEPRIQPSATMSGDKSRNRAEEETETADENRLNKDYDTDVDMNDKEENEDEDKDKDEGSLYEPPEEEEEDEGSL